MGIVAVKQWASFAYNNGHRFFLRMLMRKSTECRVHGADMLGAVSLVNYHDRHVQTVCFKASA